MALGAWPGPAGLLQATAEPPALTTEMLVVFGIVLAALVLFV